MRRQLSLTGGEIAERMRALLRDVSIPDPSRVLRSYPHELSGGMRQRVLIASAFSTEPKLILADEPTTALDVTVQKQVLRLIRRMQERHGAAMVFVTHDLGVVAQICDEVTVLYAGMVVERGPTAAIFRRPAHAYTRALLSATPRYDLPDAGLNPVGADVFETLAAEIRAFDEAHP
jgi:peptide/nickel transport system ATP-binding protein